MGLFEGVSFYISEKTVKDAGELKNVLVKGGGLREFYPSELSDWVYMSDRCGVLLPTAPFSLRGDKLFSSLVFCPSKLTRCDQEKLACLVLYYGGKMQLRLDASVTHLITMETTGAKFEAAIRHGVKIVTADWLIDSIETAALMDEGDYSLGGRGCGDHTHKQSEPEVSRCNGAVEERTVVQNARRQRIRKNEMELEGERGNVESVGAPVISGGDGARPENGECGPAVEVEVTGRASGAELRLLSGLVFHLTGYLECMEPDTLFKWKEVIVQHGGSVIDTYDPTHCTHLLALHKKSDVFARAYADGKCISSAHWLNDVLTDGRVFPPRCALHFPTAFKWQAPGADRYSVTLTNYCGRERQLVKDMIHLTGLSYTGHLSRNTSYLICKSAGGKKYEKALEWGVAVVNSSLLADIIHNGQVPAVLFPRHTQLGQAHEFLPSPCFETSRLLKPWEDFLQRYSALNSGCLDRATTDLVFGAVSRRQRGQVSDDKWAVAAKRQKIERSGPPVILLTGISQSIARKLKETVQLLGGVVSDRPRQCTHLVAPRVARTVKLLSGLSVCQWVVTPEWVEQSEREGQFANEEGFTLRDPEAEAMFSMDIPTSLARARAGRFLEGFCLHATASVQPSPDSLREIIECAGGRLVSSSETQSLFGRKFKRLADSDGTKLLVLSTPDDLTAGLCTLFTSHGIPIYNAELVLTGSLRQKLELSQHLLAAPGMESGHTADMSSCSSISEPSTNEE